jgi:hypothetical protein
VSDEYRARLAVIGGGSRKVWQVVAASDGARTLARNVRFDVPSYSLEMPDGSHWIAGRGELEVSGLVEGSGSEIVFGYAAVKHGLT